MQQVTLGDDESISTNTLNYTRMDLYFLDLFIMVYALNHTTTPGYIVSNRSSIATLVDLLVGYSTNDCNIVNFNIPVQVGNIPYYVFNSGNTCNLVPKPLLVNNATNTTPATISLASYIPSTLVEKSKF